MARRYERFVLWFPIGASVMFGAAALIWPTYGALLFAFGAAIASAALIHLVLRPLPSIGGGLLIGFVVLLLMRHFVVAIAPVTDVAVKDAKSDSPGNYLFVQCTSMLFGTDEDLPKGKPVIAYLSGLFPGRNDIDTNTLRQNIGGPPQLPSQANKFDGSSYKCVLYNYGGGPLFNVRISAHALFMKASRTRTSSGVMTQGDGVDFDPTLTSVFRIFFSISHLLGARKSLALRMGGLDGVLLSTDQAPVER